METNYTKVQSSWQQLESKQAILSICSGLIIVNILPERKGYTQENRVTMFKKSAKLSFGHCFRIGNKKIYLYLLLFLSIVIAQAVYTAYSTMPHVLMTQGTRTSTSIVLTWISAFIKKKFMRYVYFFTLFYCGYFCFWISVSVMIRVPKTVQISNATCES